MHVIVQQCAPCMAMYSSVPHACQCTAVCTMHVNVQQCAPCMSMYSSVHHACQYTAVRTMHVSVQHRSPCMAMYSSVPHAWQCTTVCLPPALQCTALCPGVAICGSGEALQHSGSSVVMQQSGIGRRVKLRSHVYSNAAEYNKVLVIESVDSISRDERGFPLTQYITNGRISRAGYTITHFKHHHLVLPLISYRMSV